MDEHEGLRDRLRAITRRSVREHATVEGSGSDPPDSPESRRRHLLADHFLTGCGIEIGALHRPLPLPAGVQVRYVDRLTADDLRAQYPELDGEPLVRVDVIDDGETLRTFDDASQDFVIANHFLEHCEDPVGALQNLIRVLRPAGVLYVAIPDKRYTFDADRPLTRLDHLLADHLDGGRSSRSAHFHEWARLVDRVDEPGVGDHARRLDARNYSIHFHVWDSWTIVEFITDVRAHLDVELSLECVMRNGEETILVVRRVDSP